MVFDTWHYHNQMNLTKLAKNLPNLTIVHDHFEVLLELDLMRVREMRFRTMER